MIQVNIYYNDYSLLIYWFTYMLFYYYRYIDLEYRKSVQVLEKFRKLQIEGMANAVKVRKNLIYMYIYVHTILNMFNFILNRM